VLLLIWSFFEVFFRLSEFDAGMDKNVIDVFMVQYCIMQRTSFVLRTSIWESIIDSIKNAKLRLSMQNVIIQSNITLRFEQTT
jgi:hypothetical protein